VTTGAENDIRQAGELARHMVTRWGMSEALGLISVDDPDTHGGWPASPALAEETLATVDREMRKIVDAPDAYASAGLPPAAPLPGPTGGGPKRPAGPVQPAQMLSSPPRIAIASSNGSVGPSSCSSAAQPPHEPAIRSSAWRSRGLRGWSVSSDTFSDPPLTR
jgi:peptidase M41-like protein